MKGAQTGPRIITFYSYKGGTGRSMALANVAWILASNSKRVLTLDWDLEAPGLHRYFHPFLRDRELATSEGIIDFVMNYAREAVGVSSKAPADWYLPFANILRCASSLRYPFKSGTLDFVPAGRQGPDYAARVNSFNWQNFYERLDGGLFLEAAKQSTVGYDYVLIDSRTGVSDTSGICTVQMPDTLVVCFTPNTQSIEGAAAVAESAEAQRRRPDGTPGLIIFPVMTRILQGETQRVSLAVQAARAKFDALLWHIPEAERDLYWGRMAVAQEPFYAFEEVLSVFADQAGLNNTMLASMEVIAGYLMRPLQPQFTSGEQPVLRFPVLEESQRQRLLSRYVRSQAPPVSKVEKTPTRSPQATSKPEAQVISSLLESQYWFYISFAHLDNDSYLQTFYEDLSKRIQQVIGDENARGFIDVSQINASEDRELATLRALASTRTFVPILSPAYLASEHCGREFQVFLDRAAKGVEGTGILPVIWRQLPSSLPPVLTQIHILDAKTPTVYRERGLRYILALRKERDAYARFLFDFAEQLVMVARKALVPPLIDVPGWSDIRNAFYQPTIQSGRPSADALHFVFLNTSADGKTDPTKGLDSLGDQAPNWKPYGRDIRLIAQDAASEKHQFFRELPVDDRLVEAIRESDENGKAVIILVDRWSISRVGERDLLRTIVQEGFANCAIVVVWPQLRLESEALTPDDADLLMSLASVAASVRTEDELRDALATAIDRTRLRLISRRGSSATVKTPLPKLL